AAFVALGMAQADKNPAAIICTSGSAALNYAPAIAEAFFQQIPLLILTADRPPEWIDQWDGQTIRQENIFGKHVKNSYNFPIDLSHKDAKWQAYRIINESILLSKVESKGPVHINIPFRKPFYPAKEFEWKYDPHIPIISQFSGIKELKADAKAQLLEKFSACNKVAFLLGQEDYNQDFLQKIDEISQKLNIPVYADVISNG
ncbi:2-succinyl-5-enolpyruvyl-6-hydroxy-3-cyclohexene-1-carboxylic-acid synthase, partial [Marivirga lumbricoides]